MTTSKNTEVWTVKEAASYLGTSAPTMRRWINKGLFGEPTISNGLRVVSAKKLRRFKSEREQWVTLAEAAKQIGIAKNNVLNHVQKGEFSSARPDETKGQNYRPRFLVLRREVEQFIARREEAVKERESLIVARAEAIAAERERRKTPEGYITLREAQRLLGLTRQRVHRLLHLGRFAGAVKVDGRWFITHEDVLSHELSRHRPAPTSQILNGEEHLTICEAARRTFFAYTTIRNRLSSGAYPNALKVGSVHYIPVSDLVNYRPNRVGRPSERATERAAA